MSALGGKADIASAHLPGPLLTQSEHFGAHRDELRLNGVCLPFEKRLAEDTGREAASARVKDKRVATH